MAITESVGRLGATLADMVRTRLELACVEVEEEYRRMIGFLLLALLALFLFGLAMLMVAALVIIVFWDSYRIASAAGMAALFVLAGFVVANQVKAGFAAKPRLLSHTVAELKKDINYMKNASQAHD